MSSANLLELELNEELINHKKQQRETKGIELLADSLSQICELLIGYFVIAPNALDIVIFVERVD